MYTLPTNIKIDWTPILICFIPIVGSLMLGYLNDWTNPKLKKNNTIISQHGRKLLFSWRTLIISFLIFILIYIKQDIYAPVLAFIGTAYIIIFNDIKNDNKHSIKWKWTVGILITSLFLGLITAIKPIFTLDENLNIIEKSNLENLNFKITYSLILISLLPVLIYQVFNKNTNFNPPTSKEISIKVEYTLAKNFESASDLEKRKIEAYLNLQLQKYWQPRESLQEIMDKISQEAKENGLTPEILQSILNDE